MELLISILMWLGLITGGTTYTAADIERIEADSDRDRWFTAQEALEYGFVDHVITRAHISGGSSV